MCVMGLLPELWLACCCCTRGDGGPGKDGSWLGVGGSAGDGACSSGLALLGEGPGDFGDDDIAKLKAGPATHYTS